MATPTKQQGHDAVNKGADKANQWTEQARDTANNAVNAAGNAANQAKDAAGNVADQAKHLAGQARDAAGNLIDSAKSQAGHLAGQAKDAVQQYAGQAKDAVSNFGTTAHDRGEDAVHSAGAGMRGLADRVRSSAPQEGTLGNVSRTAADYLERGGQYLEEGNFENMAKDVTETIRRNPVAAVLIGVGVGFLLARAVTPRGE